jgi:LacI family transcriptional regulator
MTTSPSNQASEEKRNPNMLDVAKLAGVSPMTVSRVMNGKSSVRVSTRKKVMEAAAALKYTPNQEARVLAGHKQIRVGFLYSMPSVRSGAYMTDMLLGLLNQVSLSNVQLFVEQAEEGQAVLKQTQRLIDNGLDGFILPPPLGDNSAIVDLVVKAGIPLVAVACGKPDTRINAISIDDRAAAYDMTRHLVELGHQRIGFVLGNPNQSATSRRLEGYQAAVEEFGADADPELVVQGMFNYRSGLDAAEALLALSDRPTAIFASNDDMATAAVAVAQRLGLDVPGDITVVGFDDTALATTIWPALTTVHQPTSEMAGAAVHCMLERINSQRAGEKPRIEHAIVAHKLVRRQSDAAPRIRPPMRVAGRAVAGHV